MIDRTSASRQNEARCFNENFFRLSMPEEETGSYVSRICPQSLALISRYSSFTMSQVSSCNASEPLGFEPSIGGCYGTTTMKNNLPAAYAR